MENITSLNEIKKGEKTIIYKLNEFNKKMNFRLIELGFVKGERIEVLKNFKRAKIMLVCLRGCVLSLDYSLAQNIIVYGAK